MAGSRNVLFAAVLCSTVGCGESNDIADGGNRDASRSPAADAARDARADDSACGVCPCVRSTKAPADCTYAYPPNAEWNGASVEVVRVQQAGASVPRVAAKGECDSQRGGWFFDRSPKPSALILCPSTCEALDQGQSVVLFPECREPTE